MSESTPVYQRFFAELKRRRVFRVMAVYGAVGFILMQIVELLVPALLLPEWTYRFIALLLLLGFPIAIILAWAFELTPEGVKRTEDAAPGELTQIIEAPAATRHRIREGREAQTARRPRRMVLQPAPTAGRAWPTSIQPTTHAPGLPCFRSST